MDDERENYSDPKKIPRKKGHLQQLEINNKWNILDA